MMMLELAGRAVAAGTWAVMAMLYVAPPIAAVVGAVLTFTIGAW